MPERTVEEILADIAKLTEAGQCPAPLYDELKAAELKAAGEPPHAA
jgi:hypothetical protein